MRKLVTYFVFAYIVLRAIVLPSSIYAQQWCGGCEVNQPYIDPETGQQVWIDGCNGCVATNCPSGEYEAPNGQCYPVGSGGSTGGGGGAFQGQSCGGGTTLSCGNPTLYTGSGGVGNDSNLAQCMHRGACDSYFPSRHIVTGCDGSEIKGICQGNCGCCAPGSTYTPAQTQGAIYTRDLGCNSPSQFGCSDWDDIFISRTPRGGSSNCFCDCPDEEKGCGRNCDQRGGNWIKNDLATCRTVTTTWSCVSNCTSTSPTGLSITQGASATTANLAWTIGSGGASQRLYVDQSQTEVTNGCPTANACEVNATLASSSNSYIVTGLSPATTYYFRVVTYQNSTCQSAVTGSYTTPANNTVTGRVFMDTNNNCSTSTPWSSTTYGSLTVTLRDTAYTGAIGTDGRFSISAGTAPSFAYLDLSGIPSGYICSTASGCNNCPTISSITSPSPADYQFFLTPRREAWWQAVGGNIYASGNVRSELPSSSTYLIDSGLGGAIGALTRSSGSVDVGTGAVSAEGYTATTRYRGKLMNYDYFAAHMGVTPNTTNDWAADTMNKPANNPNKVFYYLNPSGSEASVTTPWTVASGESYVVFVNGDLRIASNIIIADGGFLAFIVNGDLRVSPAVTDIAGLFVIDSTLITESNGGTDVAANFQGSVVAWGGVNFGRDLQSNNVASAAEKFTYRVDLLNNIPESMKVFALKWEEVVPGTIDR